MEKDEKREGKGKPEKHSKAELLGKKRSYSTGSKKSIEEYLRRGREEKKKGKTREKKKSTTGAIR